MRQVITNLISNALKYTSRSGRITVNIYVENHSARFTIANTAKHLSDEALLKVWDSFYRADPSRTEPGTGLGLTLVKSIVELHRGVCYVRNTVDKTEETVETAVEFGFTLPIK
jgi:signal transduction histidine kinase